MNKLFLLSFLLFTNTVFSQILTFDFNGLIGNEVSATSNSNDVNLTTSTITRGSGLTSTGTNADRFNAKSFTTTNSVSDAISNNDYFEFSITPNSGFVFSITSIDFNFERSSTGPKAFTIRSSVDSYTSDLASVTISDVTTVQTGTFTFSIVDKNSAVTFRIYAYDAESTAGSGGFEGTGNDLSVNGSTAVGCTEPTTQASSFSTSNITESSIDISFTRGNGDGGVLVLAKEGSAIDSDPESGTAYTANATFSSGDQIGTGNYVVYNGVANGVGVASGNITVSGLSVLTTYHFAVYEYNTTSTCYELIELTGNATTICTTPTNVSALSAGSGNTQLTLSWTSLGCFDEILVVASTASITGTPTSSDGSHYTANTVYSSGSATQDFSSPEFPIYKNTGNSVTATGLTNNTEYFFKIFTRQGSTWSSGVETSATPASNLLDDNFEDGNLDGWSNTTDWTNSGTELKHNLSSVASSSYIAYDIGSQTLSSSNYQWEFCLRNGNWDPSGTNQFTTFLITNEADLLSSTVDGYSVGINQTGSDDLLSLYEVTNGASTRIITGTLDWNNNTDACIRVTRSPSGEWTLYVNENGTGENQQGTITNTTYTSGQYFGIAFEYTASRAGELWVDDVLITTPVNLPVELIDFYGKTKNNTIQLFWETATELNNSHFEIERSLDGKVFTTLGEVQGYGTTLETQFYNFVDNTPQRINYYRLKQVDYDGRFEYSKTISIAIQEVLTQDVRIAPNPAKDQFNITFSSTIEQDVRMEIYNMNGQQVRSQILTVAGGLQTINITDLQTGMYIINLTTNSGVITKRIVKQ